LLYVESQLLILQILFFLELELLSLLLEISLTLQ
jgi:hypothetical protein